MTSTPESILLTRLRTQLEFYFSPPNLARDVYLRNLLNSYGGNAVPLSIIANFPKVRNLCNGQIDLALLKRSVEGSGIVTVTNDAVWISPLLPLPPLDTTKPQQRASLGATQPPQQQQQQGGVSTKEAGDGSRTPSASSSQNSLTAMANGYVNENGAYTVNNTNAATVPGRTSDSSRANQSQHPGHNSLSDTPPAQLPSQPAQLSTAAPPPHQQPHPAHPNAIPYPAAPIAHPSHGATTYAYPHYAYRYPPGMAGGPAYHHHPTGGYSAYPSHMVPYHVYGYPPYVQNDGGRGYFTGGRGSGPMGARLNGEVENGGMRRSSTGKGNADGSKKGKGKSKKVNGMQHYQNQHGADSVGNTNNYYGGSAQQQQQHQRWKERSDGGNSSGNDTYGKPAGKNHHQSRGVGKYDTTGWDRTNRGNNRSQNDIIPSTDVEGRIRPSDTYYSDSTNPLVRGGGGPNSKTSGGRKKKNKRRDGDAERRKDSNLAQNNDDPKREIFDANSFPALSPTKVETSGGNSGSNQTKNPSGNDIGLTKTVDSSSASIHSISGYADALKQTTKSSKPQTVEPQPSASTLPGGLSHNDKVGPNTTISTVVTPPPSELTTTTKVEDTFADMKITSSSTDGSPKLQEPQMVSESQTTIAVGALTGMPSINTEVEPNITVTSVESTVSLSPQSSASPADTASNVQQSNKTKPTPGEASHNIPKPPEEDVTSAVTDGSGAIAQAEERVVFSSTSSSSPPLAWGNKRSWIDVARKQSL